MRKDENIISYNPDYETMEVLASAIQKLVMKNIVLYMNKFV